MNLIILLLSFNGVGEEGFIPFKSSLDFYSDNRISSSACGRGYTGVAYTGDLSSVFINPASLSLEDRKQLYFEYVYKDDIEWIAGSQLKTFHPNFSIGSGLPINDYLQIGIIYRTENSFKQDYGEIPGMVSDTVDEGYVEIGSINVYRDFKISSFSIPIAFRFREVLSIGIDLSYTDFYSKQVLALIEEDSLEAQPNTYIVEFNKIRPKLGIIYSPIENLSLGLTYLPEARETIVIEETTFGPNILPSKIGVGISYKLNYIPLSLSLDYKRSNNSTEENLVNRNDIHFGLSYDINDNFTIRGGFFTQKDYRTSDTQSDSFWDNHDQIFTTFGLSYKISSLTINLSLMDSHLFSTGSIEQTYVNTGISYGF